MKVYLVGGAVRDKLLGRVVHDADYVVVGSTPEKMLEQGFTQVGADFPVFLHPKNKQEYALARTERKSGIGYTGFAIHASPNVTLEEDLIRRDLTINAMAIEVNGLFDETEKSNQAGEVHIIAPYGGLADMEHRVLRHVSPAFSEDPLRVLRVARFYSRYYTLNNQLNNEKGFVIADKTFDLMKTMVANGELNHLSRERIWVESERATLSQYPHIYWQTLYELGALTLFPPLQKHWQENPIARKSTLKALSLADSLKLSIEQRWAVLMATFQSIKQKSEWQQAISEVHRVNKIPKKIAQFAKLFAENSAQLSQIESLLASELMSLLQKTNTHKQPEQFVKLLMVQQVLQTTKSHHELQNELHSYSHPLTKSKAQWLMDITLESYQAISIKDIDPNIKGKAIGEALEVARIQKLTDSLMLKQE